MCGVTAPSPALSPALRLRRLIVLAMMLVPLVVDPFGHDTQGSKTLALALLGSLALALDCASNLARPDLARRASLPEILLALLIGWSALSLGWATNPDLGVLRVLFLVGLLGAVRGLRDAIDSPAQARRWIGGLLAVGVVAVLIDGGFVIEQSRQLAASSVKYASFLFVHNNLAATFVTLLAPLAAALALARGPGVTRLASVVALAAITGYLVLLHSRAGVFAAGLGVGLVLLLLGLRGRIAGRRLAGRPWLIGAALVVLLAALLPFSTAARGLSKDLFYRGVELFQFDLGDVLFRPRLWRHTMSMVSEAPLTGVGAGNFVVEYPRFERYPEVKPHAHNDALQILSELGLPGLLLFLGLAAATVLVALRALALRAPGSETGAAGPTAAATPGDYAVKAGIVASLVVFAISGLFEVPFALGASASALALLIAAATGLAAAGAPAPARPSPLACRAWALLGLVVALASFGLTLQRLPASWLITRAERAGHEGDLHAAQTWLERVVRLHTGSVQPFLLLSEIETMRGNGEGALEQVRAARRMWPHNAELAESEGDKLAALGRFEQAVDRYEESQDLSPARDSSLFKLITTLDRSGQLQAAIDLLESKVRANTALTLDSVRKLADMWRRRADELSGDERTWALVASRHFYAVLLDEGPPDWWPQIDATYRDLTHHLQILPGSPRSWFDVYQRYLDQGGWNMPYSALYTSTARDGIRLFPGWVEPYGPPMPGAWRRP